MTNEFILSLVLAIGEFESNNNDAAMGKDGERGRHQITHAKWREYSKERFQEAHNPIKSAQVCRWIVRDIIDDRGEVEPLAIYAVYNGGWNGRTSRVVQARARRFEKLWKEKYDTKRKVKRK